MSDESFEVKVVSVVEETADAHSISFAVPAGAEERFAYKPGQFLTLAVPSEQTGVAARCYSLSSSPIGGGPLTITVKRTAGGYASNWVCDHLHEGDSIRVLPPSGIFTPASLSADLLLFAAGSGITPVISITRTALRQGTGRIVLFYANRDERSVIFAGELSRLAAAHPDRLQVVHWLETVQGLPSAAVLRAFSARFRDHTAFVCGPAPFMTAVTDVLKALKFPRARRHQEKFVSLGGRPFDDAGEVPDAVADAAGDDTPAVGGPVRVEVELGEETYSFDDWQGHEPLLEFLEQKGVRAPYSCRAGECSACACVVLEGEVRLRHNDVLDEDDLADGLRLVCQAFPASEKLRITYNS